MSNIERERERERKKNTKKRKYTSITSKYTVQFSFRVVWFVHAPVTHPTLNPHSCFRFPGAPQRPSGHISLKQSMHLRSQSSVSSNGNDGSNGGISSSSSNHNAKEQKSTCASPRCNAIENGAGYVPYSPYALRRRDMISRPFSPAAGQSCNNFQRSYSPSYRTQYQASEQQQQQQHNHETSATRLQTSNGYKSTEETARPYSPYCVGQSLADAEARPYSPYCGRRGYEVERDGSRDRWQTAPRSLSPFARDYSPWRRENVDPPVIQLPGANERYSPAVQQRLGQISTVPQTHSVQAQNVYASPMVSRKRFPSEPPPQGSHSSTSPQLLISRFAHQLKQEPPSTVPQVQLSSKESAKKRFASYVRLRLGSDREPSPEPPPRFNRGESPLLLRRNLGEQASPFFPRRYVSPSPPIPPPRRLSESSSVPGSPQHLYSRLHHYTPEPQRRPPPP